MQRSAHCRLSIDSTSFIDLQGIGWSCIKWAVFIVSRTRPVGIIIQAVTGWVLIMFFFLFLASTKPNHPDHWIFSIKSSNYAEILAELSLFIGG